MSSYLLNEMKDPDFRHIYAEDQVRLRIAFLIRALRESRGLSQRDLANLMGTTQSAVARIEDPDYGSLTVKTLLNAARAFDLPLFVDMPEWPIWLLSMEDHTKEGLDRESFDYEACVRAGNENFVLPSQNIPLQDVAIKHASFFTMSNLFLNISAEIQKPLGSLYFADEENLASAPMYAFDNSSCFIPAIIETTPL